VLQHLDRVVLHDADVVRPLLANALEQRAHAGLVHLAADEIVSGAALAMWAVASPMPKPISSMSGALRPNTATGSSVDSR
jgi:hypothetical protein